MRKFYLENELGIRYNLQDVKNTSFLTSPTGLGMNVNTSYIKVGNIFVPTLQEDKQSVFTCTINFIGNAYEKFKDFSDFINTSSYLYLIYNPTGDEKSRSLEREYKRDVDIVSVSKSEKKGNTLSVSITMNFKSLYYTNTINSYVVENTADALIFPFTWDARFNDYTGREITITNNGHVEAPFKCVINGFCENPVIAVEVNGVVVHKCVINTIVEDKQKVEYSSVDGDLYVYLVDTDGTKTNIINRLDINNDNFFYIPTGVSKLSINADDGISGAITVNMYKYYKAV